MRVADHDFRVSEKRAHHGRASHAAAVVDGNRLKPSAVLSRDERPLSADLAESEFFIRVATVSDQNPERTRQTHRVDIAIKTEGSFPIMTGNIRSRLAVQRSQLPM